MSLSQPLLRVLLSSPQRFFLPVSFGNKLGLVLEGVEPANNQNHDKAWAATAKSGSISGPYPETKIDSGSYVSLPGNTATIPLSGMKFECNDDEYNGKMSFDMKKC